MYVQSKRTLKHRFLARLDTGTWSSSLLLGAGSLAQIVEKGTISRQEYCWIFKIALPSWAARDCSVSIHARFFDTKNLTGNPLKKMLFTLNGTSIEVENGPMENYFPLFSSPNKVFFHFHVSSRESNPFPPARFEWGGTASRNFHLAG